MPITPEKYIRKPLVVVGVEVTDDNFMELALWVQGSIMNIDGSEPDGPVNPEKQFILVRVHNPKSPRQSRAFVGDWILYSDRGYKVYTPKAFKNTFDPVNAVEYKPSRVDAKRAQRDEDAKALRAKMLEEEKEDQPILTQDAQQEAEVEQAKVELNPEDEGDYYLDEKEKDEGLYEEPGEAVRYPASEQAKVELEDTDYDE
jgi:hypothetical protein